MLAAVLTLTRDRLSYTKHCFESLRQYAGMEFHHFVLDQDSKDGTERYLHDEVVEGNIKYAHYAGQNIGIARGMNFLVEKVLRHGGYDAIVKIDNDCELTYPNTLKRCVEVALDLQAIVSPIVDGLNDPPLQVGRIESDGIERLRMMKQVGGIFMATPIDLWGNDFNFRYPEDLPAWGGDDTFLCQYALNIGMGVGYLQDCRVNHYRTTDGQHEDFPHYFERRQSEGGPA